jgi:metal-responsive CopG/Arc/MetJ family transcriptional regulator
MVRISLTIDEELLKHLDEWVDNFDLENKGNRSGYLSSLIEKHTPKPE